MIPAPLDSKDAVAAAGFPPPGLGRGSASGRHAARLCGVALLLGLSVELQPVLAGETWPQWRGPSRDGQFHGATWPESLDEKHLQRAWRRELGPGYSGPVVSADTVFTTETIDASKEIVRALDRSTGEERWRQEWEGAVRVPFFAKANGDWIRATPALDGDRLYVAGMRDVLVCLEVSSGRELWRVDFVGALETPVPDFGYVSSPLVEGEAIYTQAGAAVVKLNKRTGEILWRRLADEGGMWGSAFSSPVLATVKGRQQLVVQTRTDLAGLDPETGRVLWSQPVEAFRGMNILTPVVYEDAVFTSSYGGRTLLHGIEADGDEFRVVPRWEQKVQGYMSTPVVVHGHAYLHLRNQRLACLDLNTGDEKWMHRGGFGKYWSLVANGRRLLGLDQRGRLYLLEADPESYRELDQRVISDQETWAHLAVTDGQLFVRELTALSAWDWQVP